MKKLLLVFSLLLFSSVFIYTQELNLAVTYLAGERSRDSHSMNESYAINNTSVSYSVQYTGRKSKNQEDISKTCTFSEQDIKNIIQTIESKKLNVNDSLSIKILQTNDIEKYCNIVIDIEIDSQKYNIKINGDVKELDDTELYKNSLFFITMLRRMVEGCK
ncbi:MAG: hypothetical protein IT280_03280 [Ignavibacteria bacterium]|nr:hypothetical protein [Ignavibacteria bacterium]